MASDLKIEIDGVRLNVRVGVIIRHNDDVLIEISTTGRNSVIPGGRVKINERSSTSLVREIKEEMDIEIDEQRLVQKNSFENFFAYGDLPIHEIYFLYEYKVTEQEFEVFNNLGINKDNQTTYFKFISKYDLEKYNVLPLDLYDVIQN